MSDILKCKNCDFNCTSEKIFYLHRLECKSKNVIPANNKVNDNEITDYTNLDFQSLKSLAAEKGINTYRMKKAEIINELQRLEG
jgi:hypothetical protein